MAVSEMQSSIRTVKSVNEIDDELDRCRDAEIDVVNVSVTMN